MAKRRRRRRRRESIKRMSLLPQRRRGMLRSGSPVRQIAAYIYTCARQEEEIAGEERDGASTLKWRMCMVHAVVHPMLR